MKKQLLLIALLLGASITAHAQQALSLWVEQAGGNSQSVTLEGLKITFSQGNMITTVGGTDTQTFPIAGIAKLYFAEGPSAVRTLPAGETFRWSPLTHELTVSCPAGTPVTLYDASGRCVLRTIQTLAQPSLSLATLPAGIYVIEAAGKSAKILR